MREAPEEYNRGSSSDARPSAQAPRAYSSNRDRPYSGGGISAYGNTGRPTGTAISAVAPYGNTGRSAWEEHLRLSRGISERSPARTRDIDEDGYFGSG